LYTKNIKPFINESDIENFTKEDMTRLVNRWIHKGYQPRTIKQLIGLTDKYLQWHQGPIFNLSSLTKKIMRSQQETPPRALTKEEADKLLKASSDLGYEFYKFCLLGLHAGLRKSEIFGVKYSDIKKQSNKLWVVRTRFRGVIGPTKSGKNRAVPMSNKLIKGLLPEDKSIKLTDDFIVEDEFEPKVKLDKVCNSIGMIPIKSHNLRHTFATLALENDVSPKTVQQWLGHASLKTTLDFYWGSMQKEEGMDFLD
jgi:integrase